MSDQNVRLSPLSVMQEALALWARHILSASLLYGATIGFTRLLRHFKPVSLGGCRRESLQELAVFIAVFFVFFVSNAFLCLLILQLFRRAKDKAMSVATVVRNAVKALVPYLSALFLLWAFLAFSAGIAGLFVVGGQLFYGTGAAQGLKMFVLLATHTVFVVALIAGIWYGFFFSLAPLVASFEHQGAFEALKLSRQRIRGNALRYLAVFAAIGLMYVVLSGTGYWLASQRLVDWKIWDFVEAAVAVVAGPIWLAAWLVSYQKLIPGKI